ASYVASLNAKGLDQILKKVGEEATETVIAAKSGERAAIVHETADLWFHCLVMLAWHGIPAAEVLAEPERRGARSGIDEKASRTKGNSWWARKPTASSARSARAPFRAARCTRTTTCSPSTTSTRSRPCTS